MKGAIVGLFYGSLVVFFNLNKGMTHFQFGVLIRNFVVDYGTYLQS